MYSVAISSLCSILSQFDGHSTYNFVLGTGFMFMDLQTALISNFTKAISQNLTNITDFFVLKLILKFYLTAH